MYIRVTFKPSSCTTQSQTILEGKTLSHNMQQAVTIPEQDSGATTLQERDNGENTQETQGSRMLLLESQNFCVVAMSNTPHNPWYSSAQLVQRKTEKKTSHPNFLTRLPLASSRNRYLCDHSSHSYSGLLF